MPGPTEEIACLVKRKEFLFPLAYEVSAAKNGVARASQYVPGGTVVPAIKPSEERVKSASQTQDSQTQDLQTCVCDDAFLFHHQNFARVSVSQKKGS